MTEQASPTPQPGKSSDGSAVWALVVGGAILVIAALLIFAQGDSASSTKGGAGGKGVAGQQANLSANGASPGQGMGVARGEVDPAESPVRRVTPGILPSGSAGLNLAPPPAPKPEPTSFPSVGAEIAYYEKKLDEARKVLEQRTLFRERMQRNIENAPSAQARDAAEQRAKVVEANYNTAKKIHEDLVKKVNALKEKQRQSGAP